MSTAFNTESFIYTASSPTTSGFKSLPSFPSKWKQFWRLRIPLNARNTWYRFLHQKVATNQLLHQRQPAQFTTPYCRICQPRGRYRRHANPPSESITHFIYYCPKKLHVWTKAISTYVHP
ncbi:hypothetical protein PS6_010955 [Mucor atramentarius]